MTEWVNRDRKKQIIDFSGLAVGKAIPTDMDCFSEYHDFGVVFIEVKHRETKIPNGQLIAMKRLTDDVQKSGKEAIFILAEHTVDDCEQDVDISACKVRWFYYKGKTYKYEKSLKNLYFEFIATLNEIEKIVTEYFRKE